MVEYEYDLKPKMEKTAFQSKIRVQNKENNTLAVTIPKGITSLIDLKKGDLMNFEVKPKDDKKIIIDIQFIQQ